MGYIIYRSISIILSSYIIYLWVEFGFWRRAQRQRRREANRQRETERDTDREKDRENDKPRDRETETMDRVVLGSTKHSVTCDRIPVLQRMWL